MAASENKKVGAVMVAGAGIAGIQAALDLANSGFYVYLVEKKSAIGGVMAQLDKTFPTNDCSMCIISPKLVEAGRHLNIELLTLTEIQEVNGDPGNFQVKILEHPRYVDNTKCTACGECAKACPIEVSNLFDMGLRNRQAAYKFYPQAMPSAYAIEKRGTAPCRATCPAHVSVQGYIALISAGKYREAVELFKKEHPFPGVCGRVCHHPCEGVCTRKGVDEPLAIMNLHRFLADWDQESGQPFRPTKKDPRPEKVAVIGAGPAGLTCAYFLALEGYAVTVFEKLPVLGGMLTVGIPAYRLPRSIIEAEIETIRALGVEFKTGVEIGKDFTIGELRREGYKAFFLGIGSQLCKALGIEGENLKGVYPGLDFLREVNLGNRVNLGDRVAVIGGGNVAMDAVRTARRTGSAHPFIVYRRSLEEMPANAEEVEECRDEGIEIMTLTNPVRVIAEGGRVKAIECLRMRLGEPDRSGRRRPEPIPGSEFTLEVDALIPAIGQESDWACLTEECACSLSDWGTLRVDPVTLQSGDPDIFAGGDAVTGPRTVVEAIGAGKEAALSIDRFLQGQDLRQGRPVSWEGVSDVPVEGRTRMARTTMEHAPADRRIQNFNEVQLGYREDQTRREAERCLACGICSECYQCVKACLAEAVVHEMQPVERVVEVGSIIMAPGFKPFDPTAYEAYSYAHHPNVVTSMEFERILSASGPFEGHLIRPSDHKEPEKIAWLQCVGSRDINHCDHGYCSAVCCMYAIKEAVIAKEHSPHPLDTAIFFMDMRTYGKDFEKYYNRAENERGVRFIRSRIHSIDPIPESDNLLLQYVTEKGEVLQEEFDMVVLSVGLETAPEAVDLAQKLGVPIDKNQFAQVSSFTPVATERPGVFTCGAFNGPKDIPQAVMEASAAACAASEGIAESRNQLIRYQELPPEKDFAGEDIRVGVFVCNCGINIGGVADVPAVRDYARSLPHVVHVEDNLFTCSQDTQDKMKSTIQEKGINRVVVASCSPRTHEPLFQQTIREAGLNTYLFDMANIRDQDTWVHQGNPERATSKAKDLVRMAVARVSLLEPLHKVSFGLKKTTLVVGGGVAGMTSALNLAQQGYEVKLIEKTDTLGGNALKLRHTWKGEDIQAFVRDLIARVSSHPKIQVHFNTEVEHGSGFVGNYTTVLNQGGQTLQYEHGAAILATGAQEWQPDVYGYGQDPRIMTALELDQAITAKDPRVTGARTAVFIQCVGSREPERPYCSKVCCTHSVESALALKKLNPEMDILIIYRDIRTFGVREDLYREARDKGIFFVRFDLENKPEVQVTGDKLTVTVIDHVLGQPITLSADLLTLASAIIPNPAKELIDAYKISLNSEGFLLEAHMKLRPVDFTSEGIYLCGLAHYPKPIDESIAQAQAAAGRALTLLSNDSVQVGGVVAVVNPELCAVCLTCVRACPFNVPVIGESGAAEIDVSKCQGCGVCVSECPGKAIALQHFTDKQVIAKVDALMEEAA